VFEDSLVESQISHISSTKRWTALASITVQCAVAAVLAILPLLHPQQLASRIESLPVFLPPPPKPPVPVEHVQPAASSSANTAIPIATRYLLPSLHPTAGATADEAPATTLAGPGMTDGLPAALSTGTASSTTRISVAPAKPQTKPLRVSDGVSAGMLLEPIRPIYPAIAKAARIQGTVVVAAVISRAGTIESLRVLSGPAMLQSAALDAIRAAHYRPYRLNGEPTEVETRITVNFRIDA
jgi:periplasmic protein TonB